MRKTNERRIWEKDQILALFYCEISQLFLTRTLRFGDKGNDGTFFYPCRKVYYPP